MTKDTPRIYIACLAAYNSGRLHGAWIDATQDIEDIQRHINSILRTSPIPNAEEYAIHDFENFGSYRVSEYEGIEKVNEIALFLEEEPVLRSAVLDNSGGDIDEARITMEQRYFSEFKSLTEFAEEMMLDAFPQDQIPEWVQNYIDYEAYGRNMELSGDIFTIETGFEQVHVFWSR